MKVDKTGEVAVPPPPGRIEPLPNLFIVGAPKCATSAMHDYLDKHPQIFMSMIKEPMYFCTDFRATDAGWSRERYLRLFENAGEALYAGESSVFYLLSAAAAREIHAWQPRAKLIVMLRDPVDLLASHHNQIVFEGYETEKDFRRALDREAERRTAHRGLHLRVRDKVLEYREVVRFHTQISRYLELFPRQQIHVIFYEDVLADLPGVYRSVLEFLGVDADFQPDFPVHNARKEVRSRRMANFMRRTPNWFTRLAQFLLPDPKIRHQLKWKLRHANTRLVEKAPVPEDVRRMLIEDLRDEIEKLARLLDRDLSRWLDPERRET